METALKAASIECMVASILLRVFFRSCCQSGLIRPHLRLVDTGVLGKRRYINPVKEIKERGDVIAELHFDFFSFRRDSQTIFCYHFFGFIYAFHKVPGLLLPNSHSPRSNDPSFHHPKRFDNSHCCCVQSVQLFFIFLIEVGVLLTLFIIMIKFFAVNSSFYYLH